MATKSREPATPPTPGRLPVLGNGLAFARAPVGTIADFATHDDVVRFTFPGQDMYMVTGPSEIAEILVENAGKFTIGPIQRESFSGVADDAVTMSTGETWTRLRKAVQPAVAGDAIDGYRGAVVGETERAIAEWETGQRFDLLARLRRMTVRILGETLLGLDIRGEESVVLDASDALVARANFRRVGRFLPDWVPTATDRRFERTVGALDAFVGECLTDTEPGMGDDVCSAMLAAHELGRLSLSEVRHTLVAMLLAGNSSPAVTLTHAWRLLDDHPDVYARLREEYERVADGTPVTDYGELDVTRNVISETLRLFPPTTGVNRQATAPVTVGGYEFDAGAQFLLPQWAPHRDERFWDDPEAFRPARWNEPAERPDFAYFPFSGGPRHCPGMSFARQQMTLVLATMVGHLTPEVSMDGALRFTPSMTLRPANEITATVRKRPKGGG